MRKFILAIVGLLLIALLVFLIWQIVPQNGPPVAQKDNLVSAYDKAVSDSASTKDRDIGDVTITVNPPVVVANNDTVETTVNEAESLEGPILGADSVKTTLNKPVSGNVLQNDLGNSLQVSQTPANAPDSGGVILLADGRFTYTPNANFEGSDTFTYETCDSDGLCAMAKVNIQVEPAPTSAWHTVAPGEWLLQIARCYGTTVRAIRAYNYIYSPDLIYPDQVLYIPNIGSVGPYYGAPCVDYHMVKSGETLESIAAQYNISESELARINGMYTYYYYPVNYYYYGYRSCCGYGYYAYPRYGTYYSYLTEVYEGQVLILPQPVPDYMRPNP